MILLHDLIFNDKIDYLYCTFNVFKYHVSCTDGKITVRIKIGITFIFRLQRRSIQLPVSVPVGLSSFLRHHR